jgi:putative radical SAM enzyme (TIGR03279 family)
MNNGGLITEVAPNSPAGRAGIIPGERLTAVNGFTVNDIIDVQFHTYDAECKLTVASANGEHRQAYGTRDVFIYKEDGEDIGLSFESDLFDGIRRCQNNCVFCFINQMPDGLRKSLYLKDDDYRLSFLTGSYITLTNLTEDDIERIVSMRISPVRVSVHTTNAALRCRMLNNPRAGEVMNIIRRLSDADIELHGQVVVCPGYNDGDELRKTLSDLSNFKSVGVVPVGLTRYRAGLPQVERVGGDAARSIIKTASDFPNTYCADELYITAQLPIPDEKAYNEYPQLENGVGLISKFRNEFQKAIVKASGKALVQPFTVVTGTAAASVISALLDTVRQKYNCQCGTAVIQNRFFGDTVTVAGLLTGGDIASQIPEGQARVLLPSSCIRHEGDVFIDGMTPRELSAVLNRDIQIVPIDGASFVKAVLDAGYCRIAR